MFLNVDLLTNSYAYCTKISKNVANKRFLVGHDYYYITKGGHRNLVWGRSSQFTTILHGGVSCDPKFVLRNIWTAPKYSRICVEKDEQYQNSFYQMCDPRHIFVES